jgi:hypothetical protein
MLNDYINEETQEILNDPRDMNLAQNPEVLAEFQSKGGYKSALG